MAKRTSAYAAAAALVAGLMMAAGSGCSQDTGQQQNNWTAIDTGIDPASCPGGGPQLVDGRAATWTLIHYSAGDNNLEKALIDDIDEMELGHQGSANVNVIVQLDKRSEPGRWRYQVRPDSTAGEIVSEVVEFSDEEPDTGDWRVLSEFGRWAVTCYPAENYMVVVSGHGGGWTSSDDHTSPLDERASHARASRHGESLRQIAPDDSSHTVMYVDELAQALGEVRAATRRPYDPSYLNRLVMYGSDACLMQTMEVAYDLRNAVTYVVASEQTEPLDGWPYNTFVRELTKRPTHYAVRPHELTTMIVDKYGMSYAPGGAAPDKTRVTLAAVDTAPLIRARNRVDTIAGLLLELMDVDPELRAAIDEARGQSYSFGDDYTDLGRFVELLKQALVAAGKMPEPGAHWSGDERWRTLRDAMTELMDEVWPELVLANVVGEYEGARGLSIFMPTDECGWGLSAQDYADGPFASDSRWGELVSRLVAREGDGDYQVAYGRGRMFYEAFGQSFEARLSCQVRDGKLSTHMLGWEPKCSGYDDEGCIRYLDISMDLDVAAQTVTAADMWCGQLGIRGDLSEVAIGVTPDEPWQDAAYYDGRFQLSFPEAGSDGEDVDIEVYFECDAFADRSCWY